MIKLRDYQSDVFLKIHKSVKQGHNPCVVLPCRSGKSYIIAKICERTKGEVLVMAHRIELLTQLKELLAQYNNVRVASVFTEVRRLGKYTTPKIIIIDEAHLSEAMSYKKVCEYYSDSTRILFTATPARLDGKPLTLADDLIIGVSMRELIKKGAVSDFDYYAPDIGVDTKNIETSYGDYNNKQLTELMCKPRLYGDVLKYYLALSNNRQAIAYCASVKHAEQVAEMFNTYGITARSINGNTPKKVRDKALKDFKEGKYNILCNCNLISEGITLPTASVALLLRPTQSLPLFIQQACRVLTPQKGKRATIIDFVGNFQRHGLPDAEHEWSLDKKIESKQHNNADGSFTLRTCEQCYKVFHTANTCPYCGWKYECKGRELEQMKSVELKRINEQEQARIEEQKRLMRMEVGQCRTFNDLWRIQRERGYSPAWVWKMAQVKGIRK